MSHAELCPVCSGTGQVWVNDPHTTSVGYYVTCHGCGGCGWIIIFDNIPYTPSWSNWNPNNIEWWYTSDGISIRIKIEENLEKPVNWDENYVF